MLLQESLAIWYADGTKMNSQLVVDEKQRRIFLRQATFD